MRPGSIIISTLALMIALAALIVFGRPEVAVKEVKKPPVKPAGKVDYDKLPKPAKEGPHPFAKFKKTGHNFGVMQHGSSGSHEFHVTNTGKAPLKIAVGSSTCQCTVGDLKGIKVLAIGESTTIKLSWKIKSRAMWFQHSADIHTNDPKNDVVTLTIKGAVGRDFVRIPDETWPMGTFGREEDARVTGAVFSDTKDFEITKVDCSSKLMKVSFRRFEEEEFEDLLHSRRIEQDEDKGPPPRPKAAWRVIVEAAGELPIGDVAATVTLHTTLEEMKTSTFIVTGKKEGPIKIVPIPRKGFRYFAMRNTLDCGEFNAKDGLEVKMMLILSQKLDEPFKVEAVSDPKWIDVKITEKVVNNATSRHEILIKLPPGSPPIVKTTTNPAKILLKTNCPNAKEVPISLAFVSQ